MNNCIFCKIINKEIPSKILFESDTSIAFADISPKAPVHILFIPKKHIESLDDLKIEDEKIISTLLFDISRFAKENEYNKAGYRIINNMGNDGGQTVFHLHFHFLAGRKLNWSPG